MRQVRGRDNIRVRLHRLTDCLPAIRILNDANPVITLLTNDSRTVTAGALFAAVKGQKADAHRYMDQAARQGAGALVCQDLPSPLPTCPVIQVADSRRALSMLADRYYGSPSRRLRVTGITGTDGKTSTTEVLRTILNEAGCPAGSIGTLGYCMDGCWLDSDLTTPDPIALHESLSRMLSVGLTDACMEVSSHSLIQHRAADVAFDAAVLTDITRDHLDAHGTRENYIRAKRILFEDLDPDAVAVLPADTEFATSFGAATDAAVLTYGMKGPADVRGAILSLGMDGMEVVVRTPFETYAVRTSLIGDYNCLNILAAATVAFAFGIGGEVVKEALRGFRGVPGRLEKVCLPGRSDLPRVLVDYAHTPDALEKVLTVLRPLVKGRLICVLGCGGDRDRTKRPRMGKIATEKADVALFTADNSRSERTEDIIAQMVAGIDSPRADYTVEPDRRRAIEMAIRLATPTCLVAICGRGCERYQKIGTESIPFDDRLVARQLLERMPLPRRKTA
ncbi:MAG: UDP-N-acetylmuramoyl-L-alanyl-D-glutamate--2,6-diaminopimelate ligase [Candidatus Brocadiae bacterium]|nr:UDP-N-acetylmuramoyl-L-alanyl-D-glutamate--2,6-diaminopimelate ligase [Candidatus Brocadiia bacterium]